DQPVSGNIVWSSCDSTSAGSCDDSFGATSDMVSLQAIDVAPSDEFRKFGFNKFELSNYLSWSVAFLIDQGRGPMKCEVSPLSLPDVKLIRTDHIADARGYFAEVYVQRDFTRAGIADEFVQDNQSFSKSAGTVRGLHFQIPPFAQAKLVRVLQGKILDVVVDL